MTFNLAHFIKTWYHALTHPRQPEGRLPPKRLATLLGLALAYPLWQIWVRLGWLLDRLFFARAFRQEVREPVFIIGNFRSGTTFLHRLLAADERFTSTALWELYFAPSVTWRKLFLGLAHLDRRVGHPLGRLLAWFDRAVINTHPMHATSLFQPEEDELFNHHIWSTYLLLSFFPFRQVVETHLYYDEAMPAARRQREMRYYHRLIQRHLFVHPGKQYLAKNPAQTPKIRTLAAAFPQARFIHLVRRPEEVFPSALQYFNTNWRLFAGLPAANIHAALIAEQCRAWYAYAPHALHALPDAHHITLCYDDLIADPQKAVARIYAHFGWTLSEAYRQRLAAASADAKSHRPRHSAAHAPADSQTAAIIARLREAWQISACARD